MENWFNTKYYHILYKNRDNQEAKLFIDNLIDYLSLPKNAKVLDLACGRGRHSIYLNSLGYNVMGIDSSSKNIDFANQYKNDTLRFIAQDMRVTTPHKFDTIFNLFTSFGYFHEEEENIKVLKNMKTQLKPKGVGVIDFMNASNTIKNLVEKEIKSVDGIDFNLTRRIENQHVIKDISFLAEGEKKNFTEKVQLITLEQFKAYFEYLKMDIVDVFGDYKLSPYCEEKSERLIIIIK